MYGVRSIEITFTEIISLRSVLPTNQFFDLADHMSSIPSLKVIFNAFLK